ncbi:hypothetical protein [Streptomyces sp. NPDC057426]|uniref:hypothetical protein n=1 Tax=Streptomyces sp. NPDC057426 TaxID=3346128 RepID=UPI003685C167
MAAATGSGAPAGLKTFTAGADDAEDEDDAVDDAVDEAVDEDVDVAVDALAVTVRSCGRPPARDTGEVTSGAFVLVAAPTLAPDASPAFFPLTTVSMDGGLPAAL